MKHSAQLKNHKWNVNLSTKTTEHCNPMYESPSETIYFENFLEEALKIDLNENVFELDEKKIKSEKMISSIQENRSNINLENYLGGLVLLLTRNNITNLSRSVYWLTTQSDNSNFKLPGQIIETDRNGDDVFPRLKKEIQKIKNNFHSVNNSNENVVTHGLYPTLYQFNHSCNPNLVFE